MNRNMIAAATGLALAVSIGGAANAGFMIIGGGWRAEWDDSLDPYVFINPVGVDGDAVFIQKSAEFIQGPVNGIFPSIPIVFRQIEPNAVHNIVIDDEIIINNTGHDWTDFHMDLLDGGDVAFDPVATMNSGGGGPIGFSIAPFTQAAFTNNNMRLDIWGGVVANGSVWFPGDGATDGQLWIAVNPTGNTIFTLKETPTPGPGALAVLLGGLLVGTRRRRG